MTAPIYRHWTAKAGTLNVAANMNDESTDEATFLLAQGNTILDVINDAAVASSISYTYSLIKNGNQTPIRLFSFGMDPDSAGRSNPGPITLTPGQYQWRRTQTKGSATASGMLVKFATPF